MPPPTKPLAAPHDCICAGHRHCRLWSRSSPPRRDRIEVVLDADGTASTTQTPSTPLRTSPPGWLLFPTSPRWRTSPHLQLRHRSGLHRRLSDLRVTEGTLLLSHRLIWLLRHC